MADVKGNAGERAVPTWVIAEPSPTDGAALWRLARDSQALDINSSYAYMLWVRDFAATSAVAKVDGDVVAFVTGYLRPGAPDTLMVWQVAVADAHRGRGLASALLHRLLDRVSSWGVTFLETTITSDNEASIRLFSALAKSRGTRLASEDLFDSNLFPDDHKAEYLYRIGPFPSSCRPTAQVHGGHRAASDRHRPERALLGGTPTSARMKDHEHL